MKSGKSKAKVPTAEMFIIAEKLKDGRRVYGDTLADECGFTLDKFFVAICCAWFVIDTGGYKLTKRGIEAVEAARVKALTVEVAA